MHIQIDSRAGSNKLITKFEEGEAELAILEFGDIAFFGQGPDDDVWYIGIEYKNLEDVCQCIKSGRFVGTQLPGMMRLYDVCFLLIEGIGLLDYRTGQFSKRLGKMNYGFGLPYSAYENFLTSVAVHSALAGKPCIVKRAANVQETIAVVRAIYSWFQKPWDQHTNINRPDLTKIQRVAYELELIKAEPGTDDYPQYILRKQLYQIQGIGWEVAGAVANKFGTMENTLRVGQKEWESIEHIGPRLARRVFQALHGYDDPTVKKRKKSNEVNQDEVSKRIY